MITAKSVKLSVEKALKPYLDKTEEHWGYRPKITLSSQALVRVRLCRGVMEGKWHNLASFFIDADTGNPTAKKYRKFGREVWEKVKDYAQDYRVVKAEVPLPVPGYSDAYAGMVFVSAEPVINLKADFNIEGFAHKGQGCFVHGGNYNNTRKPEQIAKMLVREISSHRNTCADCGIGVAPLSCRANQSRWMKGYDLDVPPDPLEEILHPRLTKKLKERLATKTG